MRRWFPAGRFLATPLLQNAVCIPTRCFASHGRGQEPPPPLLHRSKLLRSVRDYALLDQTILYATAHDDDDDDDGHEDRRGRRASVAPSTIFEPDEVPNSAIWRSLRGDNDEVDEIEEPADEGEGSPNDEHFTSNEHEVALVARRPRACHSAHTQQRSVARSDSSLPQRSKPTIIREQAIESVDDVEQEVDQDDDGTNVDHETAQRRHAGDEDELSEDPFAVWASQLPGGEPVVLDEAELLESFVKGGGPGGQKVNKTANKVVLRHRPTGVTVRCQEDRSQWRNRKLARVLLLQRIEARLAAYHKHKRSLGEISADEHHIAMIRKRKANKRKKTARKYFKARRDLAGLDM